MKKLIATLAILAGLTAGSIATATPASALCVSATVQVNGEYLVDARPLVCV